MTAALIRQQTLSSANGCTFLIGDYVIFKRGPLDHERHGRVVGKTFEQQPRYDIESADGRCNGITDLRLDEENMRNDR